MCHVSLVTYIMSHVTYHLSLIICDLSLMPTTKDPSTANYPTMHSRLVRKDPNSLMDCIGLGVDLVKITLQNQTQFVFLRLLTIFIFRRKMSILTSI